MEWLKGLHPHWMGSDIIGIELSKTAVAIAHQRYPWQGHCQEDILTYFQRTYDTGGRAGTYLFREVLWYILPDWAEIVRILKAKHKKSLVIVELSFYDEQQYGLEYFNGPDDFIAKWPFSIEKIVREHSTKNQREGRIMVAGRI